MKKLLTSALATSVAAVALATMLATSAASAAPLSFQTILLLNGWKTFDATVRAAKVALDQDGIVHFLGGIKQTSGTDDHAFTLDPQFRPNKTVLVQTNLYLSAPGRLRIDPDGQVSVESAGTLSQAQSFASLEGVTFAK
jgi:hypothetical protein